MNAIKLFAFIHSKIMSIKENQKTHKSYISLHWFASQPTRVNNIPNKYIFSKFCTVGDEIRMENISSESYFFYKATLREWGFLF